MGIAAPIIGLALAAGGAAYSAEQQHEQTVEAKKEIKQEGIQRQALEKQLSDQQAAQEKDQAEALRLAAATRQRAIAAGSSRSTILTSPMGTSGQPNTTGKTILGL